jgi:hypothetical protein
VRYFFILLIIGLASCNRNYRDNPSRKAMIGRYHFIYDNRQSYDGTVSISNPDDGNGINISYYYGTINASTTDSMFTSTDANCPHGYPAISGYYAHDSIFIVDDNKLCNQSPPGSVAIYTVGYKY